MEHDRSRLLRLYVASLFVVAVVFLATADLSVSADRQGFWNALGTLVALALVTQGAALKMAAGSLTTSVVFVPHLAALLLLGPGWAMLIAGATPLFVEAVVRKKPLIKVVHNSGKDVVAVAVAGLVYGWAGGGFSLSVFTVNPFGFVGAAVAYFTIVNGTTATAIALSTNEDLFATWSEFVGKGFIENVLSSSISVLLAYLYIQLQLMGLLLVVVPLFFVRHSLQQNLQLEQSNRDLLELMVKNIEARDTYTSGHSVRVAAYAKALARELGLSGKETEHIETAALLHDVGKIYEEFAPVLRKEGRLSRDERHLIETHPLRSAELVGTISSLRGYTQQCVRAHHESYDGTGYPDGLSGRGIPRGARIIAVADTADAMMTDRPYRRAMTYWQVVDELERCAGRQFDPEMVRAFKSSSVIRRVAEDRTGVDVAVAVPDLRVSTARVS